MASSLDVTRSQGRCGHLDLRRGRPAGRIGTHGRCVRLASNRNF